MSINVLVIDDSALVRKALSEIFATASDIHLIDTAMDPIFAIEKIKSKPVDVIVLDVEMPRMDGITFLGKLMRAMPKPVIMLSSLTQKNAQISLQAMELGAFEVLAKPEDILSLSDLQNVLLDAVRNAAKSGVKEKLVKQFKRGEESTTKAKTAAPKLFSISRSTTDKVIAIGSSTGGTTAVVEILSRLPVDSPGVIIVQHMPPRFSGAFADRLNKNLSLTVKLAEHGENIKNGFVYIAPGDRHCKVRASGAKYFIEIDDSDRVNYHRPSVEVLFKSVARNVGRNAIGIMLTGMGEDGSSAMKDMKSAGSYNIVQDENSSVVWGMPGKVVEYGGEHKVMPIDEIAGEICEYLDKQGSKTG